MNERDKMLLALLVGAIALLGFGVAGRKLPRGIQNNNPGNIRRTGINWRGEVPDAEKTDPLFEQFVGPEWGIRAMTREILTNFRRDQNTIRAIITEWAPPTENPTDLYIEAVSKRTGIDADAELDPNRDMPALIGAIISQENGFNPYPADTISQGIRLA